MQRGASLLSEITQIVAIDGPAGVGKSSAAREAARRLDYAFLDTGAMYRAATWWVMHHGVDFSSPLTVADAVRSMPLEMKDDNGRARVWAGGNDITDAIRSQEVTQNIYRVDQIPEVRAHLVEMQRQIGAQRPTVAEGRDMGTVVFPKARCKIFVDASIEARTRRRWLELKEKGVDVDFDALRAELEQRDRHNRTRAVAPLRPADDAVILDTTDMGFEDAVAAIVALARERM